jgi:catechol 2,3-dioxygenase-like lactoylglutathione lyase family enzyme
MEEDRGSPFVRDFDWLLSCTVEFDATVSFLRDVLGLGVVEQGVPSIDTHFTRYACASLPSGKTLEVVEPAPSAAHLSGRQILCLKVRDLRDAIRDLQHRGASFASDVIDDGEGTGWFYVHAPGGNVFQVYGPHS